jgi:hypothetical protein
MVRSRPKVLKAQQVSDLRLAPGSGTHTTNMSSRASQDMGEKAHAAHAVSAADIAVKAVDPAHAKKDGVQEKEVRNVSLSWPLEQKVGNTTDSHHLGRALCCHH